jgi:hypothetical protein
VPVAQENWPCAERWNLAASISQELGAPAAKGTTAKASHSEAVEKLRGATP